MYCDICHSETCEHQDDSCPCGCGNSPLENCVYDTAKERHAKNSINGKDDEQWVVSAMATRPTMLAADGATRAEN